MIRSSLPSSSDLVGSISSEKELRIETDTVKRQNILSAAFFLIPAALRSAAGGDPIMLAAVAKAWPYLKSL